MTLRILNVDPRYPKAPLVEPTSLGYVHVGITARPGPIPLVLPSAERARLLATLKDLACGIARLPAVVKVDVFRAVVMPPTTRFNAYPRERGASTSPTSTSRS